MMVPAVIAVTLIRAKLAVVLVTDTVPPAPTASLHAVEGMIPPAVHGPEAVGPESICTRQPVVAVLVEGENAMECVVYPATEIPLDVAADAVTSTPT